jgi:hypothetical protein
MRLAGPSLFSWSHMELMLLRGAPDPHHDLLPHHPCASQEIQGIEDLPSDMNPLRERPHLSTTHTGKFSGKQLAA